MNSRMPMFDAHVQELPAVWNSLLSESLHNLPCLKHHASIRGLHVSKAVRMMSCGAIAPFACFNTPTLKPQDLLMRRGMKHIMSPKTWLGHVERRRSSLWQRLSSSIAKSGTKAEADLRYFTSGAFLSIHTLRACCKIS